MLLDVLIAASDSDPHAQAVVGLLEARDLQVACIPLADVPLWNITWTTGSPLLMRRRGQVMTVDERTTVWWRRPNSGFLDLLDPVERALAEDEIHAIFPGILESVNVRWVDAPWDLLRARQKAVQLSAAVECGARTPAFTICGDVSEGLRFAAGRRVLAKAVSSGVGMAPFVAEVPDAALQHLGRCPTMLQEFVTATADVRVVTVGSSVVAWQRHRTPSSIDWRTDDPEGRDFVHLVADPTVGAAAGIASRLRLHFSVQDWLVGVDGEMTFLEVNPQGQWLFLDRADALVAPLLATLLSGSTRG